MDDGHSERLILLMSQKSGTWFTRFYRTEVIELRKLPSSAINGGIWVGRCDMCGAISQLHLAGEFVICDDCEKSLRAEEE